MRIERYYQRRPVALQRRPLGQLQDGRVFTVRGRVAEVGGDRVHALLMAVGALLLGAPESAVSRHMSAARRTLTTCTSLGEQPAVSILIGLYWLADALLSKTTADG